MILRRLAPFACLLLFAGPASAQFINRALWLGDELEGFRRDYKQGDEYFMNRAAVVDLPPWWFADERDPFRNRLFAAAGSISSTRLTVEAAANVGVEMGSGFTGRFNYLQSEHQTTQFQRFALGIDKAVSDSTALFVQMEGTPDKSRADISFGVELFRTERSAHRLSFTLVDFSTDKSDSFDYERAPYGILFAGYAGDPQGFDLVYELGLQLPFEELSLVDDQTFRMHRTIGSVQARTRLSERDSLMLGLDGELTSKSLAPGDPTATTAEDGDIDKARLSTEWWRRGEEGREYSLGAYYLHLDEDYVRPADPDALARTRRRELMLFTRTHFELGRAWSVEPYLIGGHVELDSRVPEEMPAEASSSGIEAKIGLPLRYDFSQRAWLRFDFSLELDEFAFGGGAVQLVASF